MNKEKIGEVTEQEKKKILRLYERKVALEELGLTIDGPLLSEEMKNDVKRKIEISMVAVEAAIDNWWNEVSVKYNWVFGDERKWEISFISNEVYII